MSVLIPAATLVLVLGLGVVMLRRFLGQRRRRR